MGEGYIRRIPLPNFLLKTHGAYLGFALAPRFSLQISRTGSPPFLQCPYKAREGG